MKSFNDNCKRGPVLPIEFVVKNEFWLLWIVRLSSWHLFISLIIGWGQLILIKIEQTAWYMKCQRIEWKVKSIKIFYFPCSLFRDTPWLTNHHLMTEEYKHSLRVAAANIVCHQEPGPETTRTLGISWN